MGARRRRWLVRLALAVVVLAGGGCRTAVDIGIDVGEDGSGTVRVEVALDEEASSRFDDLSAQLAIDDLAAAGWTVELPTTRPGGGTSVVAEKPFSTPAQLGPVVEELAGPGGPIRNFALEQRTGVLTTTYALTGEVDLTAGVEAFGDDDLRQRLAGSGFGLDRESLEREAGTPLEQLFELEVTTDLPGSPTAGEGTWSAPVGERTMLAATSRQLHAERVVWLSVAALSALGLLVVLVRRARRR